MNLASVAAPAAAHAADLDAALRAQLQRFDGGALRERFRAQDEFLLLEDFLPPALIAELVAAIDGVRGAMNRNFIPGHKKGGSVSRHTLDAEAPFITALYRLPALREWLEMLVGQPLLDCPPNDPHAYALYFYTEAGDHIGWHYDTSYYKGARYTVLIGGIDRSSAKLVWRLHTRSAGHAVEDGEAALKPGALCVFNGDKLQHKITPVAASEERIALTLEYVTDPRMSRWDRFRSHMKDSIAYFGFRQVFGRGGQR